MTRAHSYAKSAEANLPLNPAKASNNPLFLADAMLGSVAKKLRVFGYDTLYMVHTHDDEILRVGIAESRTILTADRELFKRIIRATATGVLVDCHNELEDIVHILSKSGVKSIGFGSEQGDVASLYESRCSACNGSLGSATQLQVKGKVPEEVVARQNEFFQCSNCSKVYWKGGHYRRLVSLAKRINSELALREKGLFLSQQKNTQSKSDE